MAEALRDGNHITTILAQNDSTGLPEPVRMEIINDEIIVEIYHDSLTPVGTITEAPRDGNHVTTILAKNDVTGLPEAVRCDSNGIVLVDLAT